MTEELETRGTDDVCVSGGWSVRLRTFSLEMRAFQEMTVIKLVASVGLCCSCVKALIRLRNRPTAWLLNTLAI